MAIRYVLTLFLLIVGAGGVARATEDGPKVEGAWARATIGRSQLTVAYATVTSAVADRLIAVETPLAERAELHTHLMKADGTMQMRPVDGIDLKPGEPVVLKPNGEYHIMLIGLKQPLKQGDTFPMTLIFQKSGKREAVVTVENARAMAPSAKGAGS